MWTANFYNLVYIQIELFQFPFVQDKNIIFKILKINFMTIYI